MPSLTATIVCFILRTTGTYKKGFTGGPGMTAAIAGARAAALDLPSAKMRAKLDVSTRQFEGRDVWHIRPKGGETTKTVLYFHGGGYVYSAAKPHWDYLGHMAEKHGWSIVAPLYPLAPEAGAAEITAFALSVYKDMLTRHHAADLAIAGDSAGAGLAVATLMLARDAAVPLPSKAVLICPWLETNPAHPDQVAIEKRDAILSIQGISDAGKLYARDLPPTDPRVSPLHGDWSGMPPMLVFGGGDDILVTDARALKAKVPQIDYAEEAGLIHDWPIFVFPESRKAQARMAAFVG